MKHNPSSETDDQYIFAFYGTRSFITVLIKTHINSIVQFTSSEANCLTAGQETPALWNLKLHYYHLTCIQKVPTVSLGQYTC
jgi:hypothetical protein